MRFAFTDDELAFRDAVRDLLQKECPPSAVRGAWTSDDGRAPSAWKALDAMGVLATLVPESDGGLGLAVLDLVLPAVETGRAALPEPFVEHALVAAPLGATAEHATVTAALGPGADLVPYADTADAILLEDDDHLVLVPRAAATLEARPAVDGGRRLSLVEWSPGAPGVNEIGGPDDLAAAFDRGALGASAQLLGLAQQMLDTTVAYVAERRQFGVPIGSFQAIKHHLADVRIALEFAAPLVQRAAYSMTTGDPAASTHVSMAKAQASDAAALAARRALQCHGAIGYSFEHDLHLWMKRAWALVASWGDPAWHRERVARAIL
jgi:alkylation response protein AidB-like acyl-CoA dehydrogenase